MVNVRVNGRPVDEMSASEREALDARGRERMMELLNSGRAPGLKTSATRCAGVGMLESQFNTPAEAKWYVDRCKAMGGNPKATDVYVPSIAKTPGDPKAFVQQSEVESRIRKVCEDRGMACEGDIKVAASSGNAKAVERAKAKRTKAKRKST